MQWHQMEVDEILEQQETSEEGLSDREAAERLGRYGENSLADEERISRFKIFVHQFISPLIIILVVAAVIAFLLQAYIDSGVIVVVVLLNAAIGYFQEYRAEESVRALKRLMVPKARVIRQGVEREIPGAELVPGDIVLLASGVRVPADLRLIYTLELRIGEAMLTGESLPVEKTAAPLADENPIPADLVNSCFMGTAVVSGRGRGVVTATGRSTLLGTIAGEVKEIGAVEAPIQEKIEKLSRAIGIAIMAACFALFVFGIMAGENLKEMFMISVAAAVAAIPEGLPIIVTVAMAVGVSRMARQHAIVRKLPAVETLGSTTVICTDKTGTLTRNEMTVKRLFDGEHIFEVGGDGYQKQGKITLGGKALQAEQKLELAKLLRIGLICNESDVYEDGGELKVSGDPTEGALIVSAIKIGQAPEKERTRHRQLAIIPFESEHGYMAVLTRCDGKNEIFVKGAPERVLEMCEIDPAAREKALGVAEEFAARGMRVLAFACRAVPARANELSRHDAEHGLWFAGLQGMIDPPRAEAIEAIAGCRRAGMRVVMITGDHVMTARAIGKELGIVGSGEALSGRELQTMTDAELFARVQDVSIYARVSPGHKLRILRQLMNHGEIVAMTGDGVNDAPALKAAHIGIAMGITGTDVAKEASDMVLTDDNFASIFKAIKEGRIVFDNLRKVIFFLIPTGVASILSIAATMLLGMPIPYVPAQVLWINLVTNSLQDIALALEPGEKGILDRPPRNPGEGIMSRMLVQRTVLVGTVISVGIVYNFISSLNSGESLANARTMAVTTMVFFQFFQAWNSRSETESIFRIRLLGNPYLFYSMIAATVAHLAVIYAPPLQWVFRTVPLHPHQWLQVLTVSASVLLVVELDKWIRRRHGIIGRRSEKHNHTSIPV